MLDRSSEARTCLAAAAVHTRFGATLAAPATGYGFVYSFEIVLLFGTLIALGPLGRSIAGAPIRFGLTEFPT